MTAVSLSPKILQPILSNGTTYACDFTVDLGRIRAFFVGIFGGLHLQHAHAKCIDIHRLVVVFLVHFRCHEFRST